jgi:large subunit ribosomal protein L10
MGSNPVASGFANTKAGKAVILERTKALIETSSMIITVPAEGITKENIDLLRKALGKTIKASVVKNSIMGIACKDTPFESINTNGPLKNPNMFFFIPEGEAKPAFKAYTKWLKEIKRDAPAKSAVMEGVLYEGAGPIEIVTSLPTKLELITKIAIGIKAVPTKVGKGVAAVPNKLGKAFALFRDTLDAGDAIAEVAAEAAVEAVEAAAVVE